MCVSKFTIIGSENDLSPVRPPAIIWTNAGILLIGPLGPNFSEILIEIHKFSFKKMHLKTLLDKWQPFCLGLNELNVLMEDKDPFILPSVSGWCIDDLATQGASVSADLLLTLSSKNILAGVKW